MGVIGVMVVAAWATGHPLVALGATVFMVSDAVLALDRFVRARRFGSLAVMVTYHVGQVLHRASACWPLERRPTGYEGSVSTRPSAVTQWADSIHDPGSECP